MRYSLMSSVEQKIREVLYNYADSYQAEVMAYNSNSLETGYDLPFEDEATQKATQAILSIIDTEVIGGKSWHTCFDSSKCNRDCRGMVENDFRQAQRNKLRSKS